MSHLITVKLCVMCFNYIVCDIGQDICPIFFPLRILYSFEDIIFLRESYIPLRILYLLLVAFKKGSQGGYSVCLLFLFMQVKLLLLIAVAIDGLNADFICIFPSI